MSMLKITNEKLAWSPEDRVVIAVNSFLDHDHRFIDVGAQSMDDVCFANAHTTHELEMSAINGAIHYKNRSGKFHVIATDSIVVHHEDETVVSLGHVNCIAVQVR